MLRNRRVHGLIIVQRLGRHPDHVGRRRPGIGALKPRHPTRKLYLRSPWGAATPSLASLLFAIALVCANGPFLVTAILPGVPAICAPVHPLGLGNAERTVS